MAQRSTVSTEIRRDNEGTPMALVITVDGHEPIIVNPATLALDIQREAIVHGLKQKLIDAAALERDEHGRPASATDKYNAILAVYNRITDEEDPQWNGRAEGDGTSGAGLLVRAVAEATGQSVADVADVVKGWDKKTQAAMRADSTIKPIIDRMKAEMEAKRATAAKATVDTGALLQGLLAKK